MMEGYYMYSIRRKLAAMFVVAALCTGAAASTSCALAEATPSEATQPVTAISLSVGVEGDAVIVTIVNADADKSIILSIDGRRAANLSKGETTKVAGFAPGRHTIKVSYADTDEGSNASSFDIPEPTPTPTPEPTPTPTVEPTNTPTPGTSTTNTPAPTDAPTVKPFLSVSPVYPTSLSISVKTLPGTLVNLAISGYGQTLTADGNGNITFSLPTTYAGGTTMTFTVYYGSGNSLSYQQTGSVVNAQKYTTLMRGSKGDAVFHMTQHLADLGYPIEVTLAYNDDVVEVVKLFQSLNGLTVDGIAGSATQSVLYSNSAVRYGQPPAKPVQPNYGYTTLSRSKYYNSAVVTLQRRLKELGYLSGSVDGYFGSKTYRAVRNFQARNGITKTGVADAYTQSVLYSSSAIAYNGSTAGTSSSSYRLLYWGCKGSDVKQLQRALYNAGYTEVGSADGIYGKNTYAAVRNYQRDHGLTVDGVAGKKTQNSLYGTNY